MIEYDIQSALQLALDHDGMASGCRLIDIREPWHRVRDVAYSQLSASLIKKWSAGLRPSKEACDAASALFLHSNSICAGWKYAPTSEAEAQFMGETREQLHRFWRTRYLGPSICDHTDQILEQSRTGPGAAVGALGNDFYSKLFSSKLTSPSTFVGRLYYEEVHRNLSRIAAEETRAVLAGHGVTIRGSRLAFAPKNADVARCICTEPNLGIYFQLGFGRLLEVHLLGKLGINLANQPFKNRELARIGSLDDSFATIDLSSASDSMSLSMLRWALPRDWYFYLSELRSKTVMVGTREVELNMVSSMGNGFTFPLQTIFFSCVVRAVARCQDHKLIDPHGDELGNWGVFGDDIIVPKLLSPHVIRVLNLFGFRVNDKKTFVEGPFRESCGHDYYRGLNVRGVYIKHLSSMQARASVINQLNLFSTRTGLLVKHLVKEVRGTAKYHYVPRWENDDAGIHVPLLRVPVKLRKSKRYQSYLYRCWRAAPRFLWIHPDRIHSPVGHKHRIWNPDGLYLSFLRGAVNAMKIGIREDSVKYRTETGVAPNWDYIARDPSPYGGGVDWQRWETVVYLHLI